MFKALLVTFPFFFSCSAFAKSSSPDDWFILNLIPRSVISYYLRSPALTSLPSNRISDEIKYGYELIQNTAIYIGPKGKVGQYLGNRMNCSSCHMEAGRRLFGGSFASTHGNYPEYRPRENIILSLADRINYCITRPHNGRPLPYDSREMRAMLMYIKWLGEDRPLNSKRFGDELMELRFLNRAADPKLGSIVYAEKCAMCHGTDGQGKLNKSGTAFQFPPLWGPESYGIGSSMHRVTAAASFIKNNMPFGTTWEKPILTDEQAFDVAAFVNDDRIHPRPKADVSKDYQNLLEKPIDYPFGPYLDKYSEEQHKFGPFLPIKNEQKKLRKERINDSITEPKINDC